MAIHPHRLHRNHLLGDQRENEVSAFTHAQPFTAAARLIDKPPDKLKNSAEAKPLKRSRTYVCPIATVAGEPFSARSSAGHALRLRFKAQLIKPTWL
jgi:hypothetical protein